MKELLCTMCKTARPISWFTKDKHKVNGLKSYCRECANFMTKRWRSNNHKKWIDARYRRRLKVEYGLDFEVYETMLKQQNGVCSICKELNLNGRRLVVDHDHSTGKIRGLLCNRCNQAIGLLDDDLDKIQNAFRYIEGSKVTS